ncbi:MAG: hypothetical protein ABI566_01990 [Pseudolysinimonas sp.]
MSVRDDDEEAFHWAGDEVGGREGARLPSEKVQDVVAGSPGDVASTEPGPQSRPLSSLLTVLFGLCFLALTVGWILGTGYTSAGTGQLLPQVLWQFAEFTAIIAAPLWFGTTLRFTQGKPLLARIGWLTLGLGVLLPWPVLPLLVTA